MEFSTIESSFNRAFQYSFSKKKLLLMFFSLAFCGMMIVFFRSLAATSSRWMMVSLIFLPLLLSSGVLLSTGVYFIRVYFHEVKGITFTFRKILGSSWQIILGVSLIALAPLLFYLFLCIAMGLFLLLQRIPAMGGFISTVFAFAPFIVLLCFLLLSLFSVLLLFFVAPAAAFEKKKTEQLTRDLIVRIKENLFLNLLLFFVGIFPITLLFIILFFALQLTDISFFYPAHALGYAIRMFFIMLPFTAILTPSALFFFNFAAESYNLFLKRE